MIRFIRLGFTAWFTSKHRLVAENLLLRQQLIVLRRRRTHPTLRNSDRLFWIFACRWVPNWRDTLLLVKPETVMRWHRNGWRAYWRWKSRKRKVGRKSLPADLRQLIRRMAKENPLWGQRRIEAELAKLGYTVSPRSVAKYMRRPYDGKPSPGWRRFLNSHTDQIWACDLFCVRTITFQTLYVFFILHHATREIVHVRVTRHPTAEWLGQQMVEACAWDRSPPRYLIHDRDCCYGDTFMRRLESLDIQSVRTPFQAPKANAIAERWVGTARRECLDWLLIFNERHLQRVVDEYVDYYNRWRPHSGISNQPPCGSVPSPSTGPPRRIVATPVLGGIHHVYQVAA